MKFWIHTYGCQMNERDSEAATALLLAAGHSLADCEDDADLVIVNSCSVREKAEDKAIGKLRLLCSSKRARPTRVIGAMGCMAQRLGAGIFDLVRGLDFSTGTRVQERLPSIVERIAAGETRILELGSAGDHEMPCGHASASPSAFVSILLGCNRRCTYCIVPDSRGPEYSRPAAEIVAEVRALAEGGVKEVTLLGQSVMNYGRQAHQAPVWTDDSPPSPRGFKEPFPRLLEAVSAVPGIKRIRFTSGHPSGCTPELARAFAELPGVCPHLHLPVQSGSDRILKAMRRGYDRETYIAAVARLRAAVPDMAITTDVIVGFPGETEEDFGQTRSLIAEARFDNAFVFKFSPRPGTPAAAMDDDVPDEEKMRRNQVLLDDLDRQGREINAAWVGRTVEVLAEGPSLRNASNWSGRTPQNKIAIFQRPEGAEVGDMIRLKVTRAAPQVLYCE